ncbi:7,8-dihydro-8-oxoguanine triphosphatase [Raphidocelis subcapitata]|uniref:Oxidized purine nucleoside triphosphate hydrolase n=1 Tax=Raphidocelis subcapitata TaxID=307507 RepID=A0A2V0NTE5_9CHLO|nr:7,8-dihydro-8-oxoguanine triphosphatase [Raphidocelis subcapitata]|eukprot:GBF90911.1 7,8-dihydro-8-oxoguanine triphosphatase [Raphidocelis subcapitata]
MAAARAIAGSPAAAAPPRFVREVLTASDGDVKLLTLAVVRRGGRLLLGRKKRGFGEGYVNGFGGKVEPGETIAAAAAREIREECGVTPLGLCQRGILTFAFDDQPRPWEVHVFTASDFTGEPYETDEMAPEFFEAKLEAIPFDKMWADDRYWWPLLLRADEPLFAGLFAFERTHELRWWRLQEVAALPGPKPLDVLPPADGGGSSCDSGGGGGSGGKGSGGAAV